MERNVPLLNYDQEWPSPHGGDGYGGQNFYEADGYGDGYGNSSAEGGENVNELVSAFSEAVGKLPAAELEQLAEDINIGAGNVSKYPIVGEDESARRIQQHERDAAYTALCSTFALVDESVTQIMRSGQSVSEYVRTVASGDIQQPGGGQAKIRSDNIDSFAQRLDDLEGEVLACMNAISATAMGTNDPDGHLTEAVRLLGAGANSIEEAFRLMGVVQQHIAAYKAASGASAGGGQGGDQGSQNPPRTRPGKEKKPSPLNPKSGTGPSTKISDDGVHGNFPDWGWSRGSSGSE